MLLLSLISGCAHAAERCIPTPADALGPFYVADTLVLENINRFQKSGVPLVVRGKIRSALNRTGVAARIEVWQTDGTGRYYPEGNGDRTDYSDTQLDMRGTVLTDEGGAFIFYTVVPGEYGSRPPHIHYRISASGYRTLITQHYINHAEYRGPACRSAALTQSDEQQQFLAPDIYLQPLQ